jgi:hypothetical protein
MPSGNDQSDIAYEIPDTLTAIDAALLEAVELELPPDPIALCRVAQSLVIPPDLASAVGIPDERLPEKSIRSATALLEALRALDPTPLYEPRPVQHRVVGTCRHFTLLSCAFLRHQGIAARARCGFATYFDAGKYLDHWVVEYRPATESRWVRVDSEMLGFPFARDPEDLEPDEFLTGGEAWELFRTTDVDPMSFGVQGVSYAWGIPEIRGNAIRDLAALNKVEMLPWDQWGRMEASYKGETGLEYDALIDVVATTCASNDPSAIRALYASGDLTVPSSMIV